MTDPLSITASVIAIVDFALKGSGVLYDAINSYRGAEATLTDLKLDVEGVTTALHSIRTNLQTTNDNDFSPGVRQCLEGAKPAIKACGNACTDFLTELGKLMSHSSDDHFSKWDKAKLWFTEKKIMAIRYRLATYKGTLNVVLNLASFKAISENTSQLSKTQEDLDKFMNTMQGQIQGLIISGPAAAELQDGRAGEETDRILRTLESQIAALSECLNTCALAQAEMSASTGTTIKYAEALEDARQLFGDIGKVDGKDFQSASVTIKKMIARGHAVQMSGRISEDVAFAALGVSKK